MKCPTSHPPSCVHRPPLLQRPAGTPAGRSLLRLCGPRSEHQPVDHARELPEVAALLGEVGVGQVLVHHRVAEAPGAGALGVEPDDVLGLVVQVPQAPGPGVVVVVAGVAEHQDGRLVVDRRQVVLPEVVAGVAEVRAGVDVDHFPPLPGLLEGVVDVVLGKELGHLAQLGHEDEGADLREGLLEAVFELLAAQEVQRLQNALQKISWALQNTS